MMNQQQQRYVADSSSGTQIVNAYAAKKAAQMERARQLRQERELKKHREGGEAASAGPLGSARAPPSVGSHHNTGSPVEQPSDPAPSAVHSHPVSVPISRTTQHAHSSPLVETPAQSFHEVQSHQADSSSVLVGENDLYKAVQAGIITMDQCRKLWETLQAAGAGRPAEAPTTARGYGSSPVPQQGGTVYTSAQQPTPVSARKMSASTSRDPRDSNESIGDTARMKAQIADAQSRDHQPRDENGWNLDTDVAHAEPETDADFLRRQGRNFTVSSRKPAREPARPEWKAMEEESSGGFGDPPPVRKPARKPASTARKVAAKPAQSVRESSATHSEPLNIDDMPVGGGGGGGGMGRGMGGSGSGRPNFNSSGYSQYDTPAMDEAPTRTEPRRRTSARAQPPPQVQQHAHYEVDSIPVSSGMGGGGMGGGGGMDELLREAEQAQSEQQRQCHQCGRSFRESVLRKHAAGCGKQKPRKVFNTSKQRELPDQKNVEKSYDPPKAKKENNWKAQHEELMAAMKNNKIANAVERGDLPATALKSVPAPVDSRVPCPHCTRKFAPDVADRHIPKCKNILNKPKSVRRY